MGKHLFCFVLVVSSASAASLSTTAICDDVVITGTDSAMCGNEHSGPVAFASAGPTSVQVAARADFFGLGQSASASASSSADLVFTVTAGPPQGFFIPCLSAATDGVLDANATASFGGQGSVSAFSGPGGRFDQQETCNANPDLVTPFTPESFTLGAPIRVSWSLTASAQGSRISDDAFAAAGTFQFFDAAMNPISDVSFTLVEVPEPSVALLLAFGLLIVALARRKQSGAAK